MCANRRTIALAALLAAAAATAGLARAETHASTAAGATPAEPAAAKARAGSGEGAPHAALPSDRSLAAELLAINERIALLSARLKEVELQASIAAKQRDLASGAASAEGAYGSALPVVRGIDGVGRRLKATLAWESGIVQTVGEGEALPGRWRVAHIDLDTVELSRGTERVRLGFGSESPAFASSQSAAPFARSALLPAAR